ncbi:hypothetical protein ACFRAE_13770 [Sphingobacterium sp. HJSM2_6]|uniref:hypothetical protein n=1 Tax=Sphingobacterium sp. HJSM2_6 TaxID=3366264 RepID=UPI003BE55F0B
MRKAILVHFTYLILFCSSSFVYGQADQNLQADSLNYESQRNRVNELLDQRSKKFGEYGTSLEQKTGVFGLFKTKGDMQKSNEILREIVINDNHIFIETRKLLELKDSQSIRYQRLANEYDEQINSYMKTISKLQEANEGLKKELMDLGNQQHQHSLIFYIAGLLILILSGWLIMLYRKNSLKKLTK